MYKWIKSLLAGVVVLSVATPGFTMELKIGNNQTVGNYLADQDGRTLYWFKNDGREESHCDGACLNKWPVFLAEPLVPPAGLSADDFSVIRRDDGKNQTTFRGHPLYYFAGDKTAGESKGHGKMKIWFAAAPTLLPLK
ncbi:COG4315 family predicted lipoprotein [Thiovibrio sp. JS02]